MFLEMPNGEVSKSFTPGTGYKPISEMTKLQRSLLRSRVTGQRTVRRAVDEAGATIKISDRKRSGVRMVTRARVGGHRDLTNDHRLRAEVERRIKNKGYNVARGSNFILQRGRVAAPKQIPNWAIDAPKSKTGSFIPGAKHAGVHSTRSTKRRWQ